MTSENKDDKALPQAKPYGAFQNDIYVNGMMRNQLPKVTTDPLKLEAQAKAQLKDTAYNYVAGSAGSTSTAQANRRAFESWQMIPRMLRDTTPRETSINLFGVDYPSPIAMAPIGVQSIFHDDGEIGLSEVCAEIKVPYVLSTAASSSIEDVAKASGDGPRWFQLYWPQDDAVTASLLSRAEAAGFTVLVVTLDTWTMAWRPADLDNAYLPFLQGIGVQCGLSDPVFRRKFEEKHGQQVEDNIVGASVEWLSDVFPGKSHVWEDISLLRKHWSGPIVLKGIQHVDDAKMALEMGCDGIIVSNHGGRQLDGAIGSLTVLPEIAQAVGDRMTVMFDSGIRTGVDIIKALCLGAKCVLVGRPAIYGLAIDGKKGAQDVLKGLLADLDQSMGLAGIKTIKECDRSRVRHVSDVKL